MTPSLVTQGVPEGKIDIVALGERQNLSRAEVLKLHDGNPKQTWLCETQLAGAGVGLQPSGGHHATSHGQQSTQFFPGNADEAKLLFRSAWQGRQSVEKAGEGTAGQPSAGEAMRTEQPRTETAAVQAKWSKEKCSHPQAA